MGSRQPAVSAGPGNVTAWLFFRRRDLRHGRAPWPGPHRGPAGRAAGRHARGARAGPCAGGYGSAALFLISPVSHPFRTADGGSPALLARLFGNNKDCRPRGASPEGAGRVEYRCAAIGHPKVLPRRLGGDVGGSGPGRVRGLRPGCGWPGGEFEPPFARGQVLPIMCAVGPSSTIAQPAGCLRGEGLREEPRAHQVGRIGMLWDGERGTPFPSTGCRPSGRWC